MTDTQYKINVPRMVKAKETTYVAKGSAVPADILDDVVIEPETTTVWEEKYGETTLNTDDVTTRFTGSWNYDIAELSNVQGQISIEPKYSFDFPVDIVIPSYKYDAEWRNVPSAVLAANAEAVKGKNLDKQLSNIANAVYEIFATKTVDSLCCLSDLTEQFAIDSDGNYLSAVFGFIDHVAIIPGNFENVDPTAYDFNDAVVSARDMARPENWDVVLSAHPTYRMKIFPKFEKFNVLNYNMDKEGLIFFDGEPHHIYFTYLQVGKPASQAIAFDQGSNGYGIQMTAYPSYRESTPYGMSRAGLYAYTTDGTVSVFYQVMGGFDLDDEIITDDHPINLSADSFACGASIHLKKAYMNDGEYDLNTAEDLGACFAAPGFGTSYAPDGVVCPDWSISVPDLMSMLNISDADITDENIEAVVWNDGEEHSDSSLYTVLTDLVCQGNPVTVYIVLKEHIA